MRPNSDSAGSMPDSEVTAPMDDGEFRPRCLSLDLEVGRKDGRIRCFGAVRGDNGRGISGVGNATELAKLDKLAEGAEFLLGHNLIEFDIPHLMAAMPDLGLLRLPVIDTLRLSPIAFPSNPYHNLVKHYKDGSLMRTQRNDPFLDSRLALQVFREQRAELNGAAPDLLAAWHWLCTPDSAGVDRALDAFFAGLRGEPRPSDDDAREAIASRLEGSACSGFGQDVVTDAAGHGLPLAYALAWLSVAGGNSVIPPWVLHQFPETGRLVSKLRDNACSNPACAWCRERHDAGKELKRWFGFDSFRPHPADDEGYPLQQAIVEAAMAGKHVFGILPTGTGKSLCYQIPALSRYDKTGKLTVVISPLVALMADQVAGLERQGIGSCVTINGLLSMPERSDALDRVRLGDAGILLISPEQLRSRSVRGVLDQREIGGWVLDEAHCLSRWGHDFRPDYRYVGRFIRQNAGAGPVPPVLCLTATAKPDVVEDIRKHFRDKLGVGFSVFDGGTERTNLEFQVIPTTGGEKLNRIHEILLSQLPQDAPGGAIIYCATRRQSEEIAEFLQLKAVAAAHFHAGLSPEIKKDVQQQFIEGKLRAIAATNAFGMGIDKPDVRLVIHADIPGSLENYLQEAGRAGRDREAARCVLLYSPDDVERQFGMSARSRLTRAEIHGILRALRNLDRNKRYDHEVVATTGEILNEDEERAFERDSATDDTRVRTAVAWLEEAQLLTREENVVQVFPSSLLVYSIEEAGRLLSTANITQEYRFQLLQIARRLIESESDEGISTDELMEATKLDLESMRTALYDLERFKIASNDTELTAFVHVGVQHSSMRRLDEAAELEQALIDYMREAAPDLGRGDKASLHLRIASQVLRDNDLPDPLPERLWRIVRGIAYDGRGEDGAGGSLSIRKQDAENVRVTLRREWALLGDIARRRREGARRLLEHLISCLPSGSRGMDQLAETTIGRLLEAIETDLLLKQDVKDTSKLLDRALLWLHELDVIRLNKGMAVFRPAMKIRLEHVERRGFAKADFIPLELHYRNQVLQIHVMEEFAKRGLSTITDAIRLAVDYFALGQEEFLDRWLPGRVREIHRQTTPKSWEAIVGSLGNPVQQRIVADDREQTNVLVLAGPGSGKTRVLVHRIAYLVRARRENPGSILALAYNRHAAVDIRRRLDELIGKDARGVTVLTCHALAMRLAGASFRGLAGSPDEDCFDEIIRRAVALLRGEHVPQEEADEQRERLLAGFRWILVDEYQDIGADQYDLISALAGRTRAEDEGRLTLFAVGDDDQNIYSFNGTSVEFIRRFEADYSSKPLYLTANYRSTAHIIEAANAVIEPARERMKSGHPIRINRERKDDPPGGRWESLDPVARGSVQVLSAGRDPVTQARHVMAELQRLAELEPGWDWSRCAVIAREWEYLVPVRAICEMQGVPSQLGNEEIPSFWRLRETSSLVNWIRGRKPRIVDGQALDGWLASRPRDPWHDLLRQAMDELLMETAGGEIPADHLLEWLAEWGRDVRRRQQGLLLLSAHRAKGLEFDHVAVLDGGWNQRSRGEDIDEARRLYYVAMTRAGQTLTLARMHGHHPFLESLHRCRSVIRRQQAAVPAGSAEQQYRHVRVGLKDVDLGYAGRLTPGHRAHRAIAALAPGSPLKTRVSNGARWELTDKDGTVVGRLAGSFNPPNGTRCRSAEVFAIVRWDRDASDQKYHDSIKSETWEVVVPELVFEPVDHSDQAS